MESGKRKPPTRQTVQSSRDEAAPILLGIYGLADLVLTASWCRSTPVSAIFKVDHMIYVNRAEGPLFKNHYGLC